MIPHRRLRNTLALTLILTILTGCQTATPTTEGPIATAESLPTVLAPALSPSPLPPTSTTLPPSPTPPFAIGSIVNGDFETGDLTGWLTTEQLPRGDGGQPPWGAGSWLVYDDGSTPPDPSFVTALEPWEFRDPPQGLYASVASGGAPGRRVLYQDVMLDAPYVLQFTYFYFNRAHVFDSPGGFRWDGQDNNQFRVDLMDATAPLLSLDDADVLANILRTREGDPLLLDPTRVNFDLTRWVGQVVRIRFVEVDNKGPLRVGLDDIRLEPIDQ